MKIIEKIREAGKPEAASHLEELIKTKAVLEFITIRDDDNKAYETELAQWLMDNYSYRNHKNGFSICLIGHL